MAKIRIMMALLSCMSAGMAWLPYVSQAAANNLNGGVFGLVSIVCMLFAGFGLIMSGVLAVSRLIGLIISAIYRNSKECPKLWKDLLFDSATFAVCLLAAYGQLVAMLGYD